MPFTQQELEYIARLDGDADAALLARELPDLAYSNGGGGSCLRALSVSTRLLQRCAAAGLTLADIGALCSRPLVGMEEEPSQLERVCWGARAEVDALRRAAAKAKAEKAAELEGEEDEEESELISAAVVEKRDQELLTTTPPDPAVSTSLGAVSTPALVSEAAGIAAALDRERDSSSSPPPPLSFISSLGDDGSSRSDSGGCLLPPLQLLPTLASQASTQSSHPEDLLFELEGAAANGQQLRDKRFSNDDGGAPAALAPASQLPSPLSPQQSLNPATGGAWSPLFRGGVLPGSSAESGSGGFPALASASAGAAPRPSSSFGSLPPTSPRPLSSSSQQQRQLPPTSPGSHHLRGAPLGTSLALAGGCFGGGGGARGGGGAAAEAAAAGFARRPATARERLRARALAALGGSSAQKKTRKKSSVRFNDDSGDGDDSGDEDEDDCLPPPGVSSAKVFAGLEGEEWAAFVEAFDERVCAALRSGIWRNIAAAGGVVAVASKAKGAGGGAGSGGGGICVGGGGGPALGVSCPRF